MISKVLVLKFLYALDNDDSTENYRVLSNKGSSSLKRKDDFPKDSCTLKTFRISKSSKDKYLSTIIDNRRSSCCMTELFYPKSLVHIHDAEHRLFSISSLLISQTNEELLTQKTNECVDQIFNLLTSNPPLNITNDSCQMELVFPLYTQSQLNN
jgi:hypothetical protein